MESTSLDLQLHHHTLLFKLKKEQPIYGKVVDPNGQPVSNLLIDMQMVSELDSGWAIAENIIRWEQDHSKSSGWLKPVKSDSQGRFLVKGLRQTTADLFFLRFTINDERYAPFNSYLSERSFMIPSDGSKEIRIELEEARLLKGRVLCGDTGEPIADAWLSVVFTDSDQTGDLQTKGIWTRSDDDGRFQARGCPRKNVTVYVYPPSGLPYPAWVENTPWPDNTKTHSVTIRVPKGVLIRGRVVNGETNQAVGLAEVEYQAGVQNTFSPQSFVRNIYWAAERNRIQCTEEGLFEIAVIPGPGYLMVKAPTPEYVSRYITHGQMQFHKPGGFWYVMEGFKEISPSPEAETMEISIPLCRGVTVRGFVTDPNRAPVDEAVILTADYPQITFKHISEVTGWPRMVKNGRFELQGCDPKNPRRVYFLNVDMRWGATVDIDAAKAGSAAITVPLLPCGQVTCRLTDTQGIPLAGFQVNGILTLDLILKKGPVNPEYASQVFRHLSWWMTDLNRKVYHSLRTDDEGYVTFPGLIPDACYLLRVNGQPETIDQLENIEFYFKCKSNQNIHLGRIVVRQEVK